MNKAILIGNLTRDPEVRTTGSGTTVCTFTIAVIQNRSYDAKDGSKRYITEIIADEIEFLTPKGQESGSGSGGYERSGFERQNTPAPEGFSEIEDDELPF